MTICKAVDFPVVRDVVVGGDGLPPLDPTVAAAPRPLPLLLVALTAIAAVPQVHGAPGDGVGGPRLAPLREIMFDWKKGPTLLIVHSGASAQS